MADAKGPVFNPLDDLKKIFFVVSAMWFLWFINGGPAKYESSQIKPFLTTPETVGADDQYVYHDPLSAQYGDIPDIKIGGGVTGRGGGSTGSGGTNSIDNKDSVGSATLDGSAGGTKSSTGESPTGSNLATDNTKEGQIKDDGKEDNTQTNTDSGGIFDFFKKPKLSIKRDTPLGGDLDSSNLKKNSYLKIDFSSSNTSPLKITGSMIKSIFGKSVVIPGGSELPYQGMVNEELPIVANPGSKIYLIQGESPIGVSFMVNKCMGHLAEYQAFYPALPPIFNRDITYNVCVERYKYDKDFYLNDWRIYFGKSDISWLWSASFIRIIDSSGKTLVNSFY